MMDCLLQVTANTKKILSQSMKKGNVYSEEAFKHQSPPPCGVRLFMREGIDGVIRW